MDTEEILTQVASGTLSVEEAQSLLATQAEADLGFARLDLDRLSRCGIPEVIYAERKTSAQIIDITSAMKAAGQPVFISRTKPDQVEALLEAHPDLIFHEASRIAASPDAFPESGSGAVAVVSAGTSDLSVAEEAALTARLLGAHVEMISDVGVAGLHRLLKQIDKIRCAHVVIVVAGMEGALPSVIGGLIDKPIIAVPTSVGYGMNLEGVTTLLAMLNSCSAGITVVNVDNGFGAGVAAGMINRQIQ